jgi:hypothetical protein
MTFPTQAAIANDILVVKQLIITSHKIEEKEQMANAGE